MTGLLLIIGFVVAVPQAASADYIYCPPDNGPCVIRVGSPGGGGGGGGGSGGGSGSGAARCWHDQLQWVPCRRQSMGWFSGDDACYYRRLDLALDDPLWRGNDPTRGFIYSRYCWQGNSAGWVQDFPYRTSTPPGYGQALPSPMSLALQAISLLPITGPAIGLAPDPAGSGLVGLPVWMWTSVSSATWGTSSATASVPGLSVTATATAQYITWSMGDGAVIRCNSPGTPYLPSYGDMTSLNCGHRYTWPSRVTSSGQFAIRATTRWHVTWSGGGRSGTVDIDRFSETSIRINELQVVTG